MTIPRPPRRSIRVVLLLSAVGIVLGGTLAARAARHRRAARPAPPQPARVSMPAEPSDPRTTEPADPHMAGPSGRFGASRLVVWIAVGLVVAVLAIAAAIADRSSADSTVITETRPLPVIPDICVLAVSHCGGAPETPAAQPTVEVIADSLTTGGRTCTGGSDRPVLDTLHPTLSATGIGSGIAAFEVDYGTFISHYNVVFRKAKDTTDGNVASLILREPTGVKPGGSYRWRARGTALDAWSPWCGFRIAKTATGNLGLDNRGPHTVTLPPSTWRLIVAAYDWQDHNGASFAEMERAGEQVTTPGVAVTLPAAEWELVADTLAYAAAQWPDPDKWELLDLLSTKLGGARHPTLGYPRD